MHSKGKALVLFFLVITGIAQPIQLVVIGESGVGKSTFINWLSGTNLAREGHSNVDETEEATAYEFSSKQQNFVVMDTPGFRSAKGWTDADIRNRIEAEILRYDKTSQMRILILLNATSNRYRQKFLFEQVSKIFGNCSGSVIFAINRIEKLDSLNGEQLLESITKDVGILGVDANRVIAIDTKGEINKYYDGLLEAISKTTPLDAKQNVANFQQKIDAYYEEEIKNENNYETIVTKVPKVIMQNVLRTLYQDETYQEKCNCRENCWRRGLFRKKKCEFVCDTCTRTRKVPVNVNEVVPKTIYENVSEKKLKNELAFYRTKALERLHQEIHEVVFNSKTQPIY